MVPLAAVVELLERLPPAERAILEPFALPRSLRRARRLAVRNAAIGAARAVFTGKVTITAKAFARALAAYSLSNWHREQHLEVWPDEGVSDRHRLLHAILSSNRGRPLGWRRICDIWAGRSVASCATFRTSTCNRVVPSPAHGFVTQAAAGPSDDRD
jgi:hypothetical protein